MHTDSRSRSRSRSGSAAFSSPFVDLWVLCVCGLENREMYAFQVKVYVLFVYTNFNNRYGIKFLFRFCCHVNQFFRKISIQKALAADFLSTWNQVNGMANFKIKRQISGTCYWIKHHEHN